MIRGMGSKISGRSWIIFDILVFTIIISLVFVSGCSDTLFGSQKVDSGSPPMTTIQTPVKALWTQPKVLVGSGGNQLPEANSILKLPHADEMEMDGDVIVWTDGRNFDDTFLDIYMYNIATKQESPLIVVRDPQKRPAISGNTLRWTRSTAPTTTATRCSSSMRRRTRSSRGSSSGTRSSAPRSACTGSGKTAGPGSSGRSSTSISASPTGSSSRPPRRLRGRRAGPRRKRRRADA